TGEKAPMKAWALNMDSLFHVLNLAKDKKIAWKPQLKIKY
ncbi:MAG: NAD-dependent epimerase, partial [Flavobacteriaceae bacterium]|nr:NAD-dependent epimerase [Flavobacteriaceae bacterium]